MKKFLIPFLFIFVLTVIGSACSASPQNADLNLVAGSNGKLFLGSDYRSEGLLKAFYEDKHIAVRVSYVGGPEAELVRDAALSTSTDKKTPGSPDAFMFDDQLFAKGLKDLSYPARSFVGVWIRKSKAESLGLTGQENYLDHSKYGKLLEDGSLKIVTSNANQSTAAALEFFATMSACTGKSGSALTAENIQSAKDCGKRIYDHYARSAGSTGDSVNMVYNDALQGTNLLDGVIAFQSSFAGANGLNAKLVKAGKEPFIFVYFSDASPVAAMALGNTGNLTDGQKKAYDEFAAYLLTEKAQGYINRVGLISGSSAFGITPDISAFNADWGLNPNPAVNPVNAPVYNVAKTALSIYTNMYKRAKDVRNCLDVSGSMSNNTVQVVGSNGKNEKVTRLQALDRAVIKLSDNKDGKLTLGPNDHVSYYLFSKTTVGPVAETTGPNTKESGTKINSVIGDDSRADGNITGIGVDRNGTGMFDCAQTQLNNIVQSYSPDIDYYIVLMTDGENNVGMDAETFLTNWQGQHKINITVVGIAFGTDGSSVHSEYTVKFGGNTYPGNNDADLFEAFKNVFNR